MYIYEYIYVCIYYIHLVWLTRNPGAVWDEQPDGDASINSTDHSVTYMYAYIIYMHKRYINVYMYVYVHVYKYVEMNIHKYTQG